MNARTPAPIATPAITPVLRDLPEEGELVTLDGDAGGVSVRVGEGGGCGNEGGGDSPGVDGNGGGGGDAEGGLALGGGELTGDGGDGEG